MVEVKEIEIVLVGRQYKALFADPHHFTADTDPGFHLKGTVA
jgi:hypothetical protein